MTNMVFFTMEMKYILIKGDLALTVGEFGPVETEWTIFTMILVLGGLFGGDAMQNSLADVLGIQSLSSIKVKHVGGGIFLPL